MLKKIMNEAHFTVRITTTGPLLVKSGLASVSGPDMTPVRTFRNNQREIFIPGSSLKGVFRSHIERVVCSLKPRVVCYPFAGNEAKEADLEQRRRDYRDSCGDNFNKIAKNDSSKKGDERRKRLEYRTDIIYAASCPTCRLFGSTSFIGRVAISDAYLAAGSKESKEQRDGVGIDRLTGGASHGAKFELEVVSTGVTFETEIHLRNFEIWQLGMLFVVLQDMEDQLIPLGSGRSRGLGKVEASISEQGVITSTIRQTDREEPDHELWGLGKWLDDSKNESLSPDELLGLTFPGDGGYGTWRNDLLTLSQPGERSDHGIRSLRTFKGDALVALRTAAMQQFVDRMRNWPTQDQAETVRPGRRS
jgi:CRISPR-associated RAMP protein (TIGR02581 family)